ncbi:hypothetical protein [Bradyrhizobium sp. SZCCHNS3002]|nr:hypothetical protein [Bradyrhizobium sp. SZCCHNS3002]
MSDHPELHVKFLGLSLSAKGAMAIAAAMVIVLAVLGFYRF